MTVMTDDDLRGRPVGAYYSAWKEACRDRDAARDRVARLEWRVEHLLWTLERIAKHDIGWSKDSPCSEARTMAIRAEVALEMMRHRRKED